MQEKKNSKASSEVKAPVNEVAKKVETAVETATSATKEEAKPAARRGRKPGSTNKATNKAANNKKKEDAKTDVIVQIWDKEFNLTALEEKVKTQFVADGHRAGCIKNLNIYAKPEEGKAYYVINDGKFSGEVYLF
jgi:hypothetical protein